MKRLACLAVAVLLAGAGARAQEADFGAQRERLRAERATVEARFAEEQKACRAQFAVTDCLHRVTRERNATLADLRRQEIAVNDAERRDREAKRQRDAAERQAVKEREDAERRRKGEAERQAREERAAEQEKKRASQPARTAPAREAKAADGAPSPQGQPRAARRPDAPSGPSPEEAAKNRQDYERRLREAEAHKAEVRARIARRTKPAASALPAPATPASGS